MNANLISEMLKRNLKQITDEVHAACHRVNRKPEAVRLVAVTKYALWPWVEQLATLHRVFGENRPQQLAERHLQLPQVEWHLIGQLQRNKVRLALSHATVIHSVDSVRLLHRIAEVAAEMNVQPALLLQVNTTGEVSKAGFAPLELIQSWSSVLSVSHRVRICGLMTMAEQSPEPETARSAFQSLRNLRDDLQARDETVHEDVVLSELSMGMSDDFVQAVEEGSTLIRIGSRVFDDANSAAIR